MRAGALLLASMVVMLWLACPVDVVDHGCSTSADCACGDDCFSLDGGANSCNHRPPPPCTTTADCAAFNSHSVCSETFRAGTSCGLSCSVPVDGGTDGG